MRGVRSHLLALVFFMALFFLFGPASAGCRNGADANNRGEHQPSKSSVSDKFYYEPLKINAFDDLPKYEPLKINELDNLPKYEPLKINVFDDLPKYEPFE